MGRGVGARDGTGGGAIGGCMQVVASPCLMGRGAGGACEGTGGGGVGGCTRLVARPCLMGRGLGTCDEAGGGATAESWVRRVIAMAEEKKKGGI